MKKGQKIALGVGLVAAAAGATYLYGTKKGAQTRKKISAVIKKKSADAKKTIVKAKKVQAKVQKIAKQITSDATKITKKYSAKKAPAKKSK